MVTGSTCWTLVSDLNLGLGGMGEAERNFGRRSDDIRKEHIVTSAG